MNHREALAAVVNELTSMPETAAILFFGSAQRGEARPGSDLDLYVVTSGRQFWRAGRVVQGVPVELFFNPVPKMRQRMEQGDAVAIHAFATGELLLDRTGDGASLQALGRELLAGGPKPLSPWGVSAWRYRLTDLSLDIEGMDPATPEARMQAGALAMRALEGYFALNRLWSGRPTGMIRRVAEFDAELGALCARFFAGEPDPSLAVNIADRVLGPFGGRIFEYESERAEI